MKAEQDLEGVRKERAEEEDGWRLLVGCSHKIDKEVVIESRHIKMCNLDVANVGKIHIILVIIIKKS